MTEPGQGWTFSPRVPKGTPGLELKPGLRFADRFRVVGLLGRGGIGAVYRAVDEPSGREVALKVLICSLTATRLERFRREGELTAALRHPAIVTVHASGTHEGVPYLAYELVEGGRTLEAVLAEDRREALHLLGDVASAVGFAHAQGVIHRDLKPENVLIGPDGRPRVADFGLARAEADQRLTRSGVSVGTPSYMAPEQLTGGDVGPPADVWALGVILYRTLTGELPFPASSLFELTAQVTRPPRRPSSIDPAVSPQLDGVVLKALAKAPGARYREAGEFAESLRAAVAAGSGRPGRLRSIGLACLLLGAVVVGLGVAGRSATESPAATDRGARDEALELERRGEFPAAAVAWRRAVAHGDDDAVARLADALWRGGDFEQAEAVAREWQEASSGSAASLSLRVRVAVSRGVAREAREHLRAYRVLDDGPASIALEAAVLRAEGRDPRPTLRSALLTWPTHAGLRLALAEETFLRGRARAAWSLLAEDRAAVTTGLPELLEALSRDPPHWEPARRVRPALRSAAIQSLLQVGERELGFLRWEDDPYTRGRPADALAPVRRRARAERALAGVLSLGASDADSGRAHLLLGELPGDLRLEHAEAAVRLLPGDPGALLLRARLQQEAGRHAEAREDLAAVDPDRDPWLRAQVALALGETSHGVACIQSALAARPDDPRLHAAAIRALRAAGRAARVAPLEARLELLRGSRRAEAEARLATVGNGEDRQGDEIGATQRGFKEALALDPLNAVAAFRLGKSLVLQGELVLGLSDSLESVRRHPRFLPNLYGNLLVIAEARRRLGGGSLGPLAEELEPATHAQLGVRAFLMAAVVDSESRPGWVDPAIEALNALLAEDPALVWAYVLRAGLELRAGHLEDADADLETAQEAAPDCGSVDFLQALLAATRREPAQAVLTWLEQAGARDFSFGRGELRLLQLYPAFAPYLHRAEFLPYLDDSPLSPPESE